MNLYPNVSVQHLTSASPDHGPILLELDDAIRSSRRQLMQFWYELMWETHTDLKEIVGGAWREAGTYDNVNDVHEKLSSLAGKLGSWSNETFGSVRKEIKSLKAKLVLLRDAPGRVAPSHAEIKINDRLVKLYHREEIMWK
jgi:hypothetical protein